MNNKVSNTSKGTGVFGLLSVVLTAVFVVLKLLGKIDWNWWLVFLPILAYVGLCAVLVIVILVLYIIVFKDYV